MFIKDLSCISAQETYNDGLFDGNEVVHTDRKYFAQEPNYMEFIPHGLLRRMGRVVRLGIGTGIPLIQNSKVDGIILGTANGGLEDCFKFLDQLIKYEEGTLTPTNFVQSTANAIAGGLALMDKNVGYNCTHVNGGLSFENALMDASLLLESDEDLSFLVGGADELSDFNYNVNSHQGLCKAEEVTSAELLTSGTAGTIYGEGSAMFVIGNNPEKALARIVDIDQITYPDESDIEIKIENLLDRNNLNYAGIDTILLGYNGDSNLDHWYQIVENKFTDSSICAFKHLSGEYNTVSGFATWLATKMLNGQKLPSSCVKREGNKSAERILIYNHYKGEQHGFILIEK